MTALARTQQALTALTAIVLAAPASAAPPDLAIRRSDLTGRASFVKPLAGDAIALPAARPGQTVAARFLDEYGHLFGIQDPADELALDRVHVDDLGQRHTSYRQVHRSVPVFSGVLRIHEDARGRVIAANGHVYPIPDRLDTTPTLTAAQAARIAKARTVGAPQVEQSSVVIVDPAWYGDPPAGPQLAYYIILTDMSEPVREAFFIQAHKGVVIDHWNLLDAARDRVVFDDSAGVTVRTEGDPPAGDFDADSGYDYSGDFYDYFFRGFGRDSYDDFGSTLNVVVHLVSSSCPNAFGGGGFSVFCTGTASDDVVAHEWGHSLTGVTAGLIYQNQSGQLNESYSDIWGELIDLFNGDVAFPGTPGGTPWPTDATYIGPGTDTPNAPRTDCLGGVSLDVNSPPSIAGTYVAGEALFGPSLTESGTSGDLALAEPREACSAITNAGDINGRVALVDRGSCAFSAKVANCQAAGAIAVVIANNVDGAPPTMSPGTSDVINIPSLSVTLNDGALLRSTAEDGQTVNVTLRANPAGDSVRWLMGEDASAFGGAIRDMWQPSCKGDPDTANHPFQICHPNDNGGVHSGSGVPNHAFAIMVDGKSFNGFNVNAIGPVKAAAVWFRALATYLTPASNFEDAYVALNQAASDLVGSVITDPRDGSAFDTFTSADAAEVDNALQAVEMNTPGLCGSWKTVVDATPPSLCEPRTPIYADDFESGTNGWTVFHSGPSGPPTPYDWIQVSGGLPFGRSGTVWFAEDRDIGDCGGQDESAVHSLRSPPISLPSNATAPMVMFTHYVETETFYDGGNIRISVNGGSFQLIPATAIVHNAYNNQLAFAPTNTNPLAGQNAWTGYNLVPGDWGTTLIDLIGIAGPGDDIQVQFDFGKDGCTGFDGWYVDDFEVFTCVENDCNGNGIDDAQDIADGTSQDENGNGIPDECECSVPSAPQPETPAFPKNRFLSFQDANPGDSVAVRVRFDSLPGDYAALNGRTMWLAPPQTICENAGQAEPPPDGCASAAGSPPTFPAAALQCAPFYTDWAAVGLVHVFDEYIVPGGQYSLQVVNELCDAGIEQSFSPPLAIQNARWADSVSNCGTSPCGPPNDVVDVNDVVALLDKFQNRSGAILKVRADLEPGTLNFIIDVGDVLRTLDAFAGAAYPFAPPAFPCP